MTELRSKEQIVKLERIVNLRLLFSRKWSQVNVYTEGQWVVVDWSHPKRQGCGSNHTKAYPLSQLSEYLRSQKSKLRYEFKNRHNNQAEELKP